MTADHTDLVQGKQSSLQPGTEQDYRQLEHDYHQSAAYAEMVDRYPLLRRTIAACRGKRLVGHGKHGSCSEQEGQVSLQWERSHGEN